MERDDLQKYFFHYRQGRRLLLDLEGQFCSSVEHATTKAINAARDIMASDIRAGVLDLEQEIVLVLAGKVVAAVPFADTFTRSPG